MRHLEGDIQYKGWVQISSCPQANAVSGKKNKFSNLGIFIEEDTIF